MEIQLNRAPIRLLIILSFLGAFLIGCKMDSSSATAEKKVVTVPAFDGSKAYQNIEAQLAFGYRIPGTEAHSDCADWLASQLEAYGAKVIRQPFKANFMGKVGVPAVNIMGQFKPQLSKRVLLAAHWDSRAIAEKDPDPAKQDQPIAGADDGASGVAVLLEIARLISENPIDLGVDIIFFDAEDQGDNSSPDIKAWGQGSQYWSQNKVPANYRAKFGILLDMVGSKNATFGKEEYSVYYARTYVNKIWDLAARMGYSDFFQDFPAGSVTDDHYFVNVYARIPMLDIINMSPVDRRSFGAYHHTHDDDIDIISERTLKVVGQVVTAALYRESEGTL